MGFRARFKLAWYTVKLDMADVLLRLLGSSVRKETAAVVGGSPALVVDLLTGTGSVLIEYATRFPRARIIAIDMRQNVLDIVRQRMETIGFSGLETITADARDLPLADESADVVNIAFGLHENDSAARARILEECHRVLKPGGSLVVTDYREVSGVLKSALMRLYLAIFEPRWIEEIFHGGLEDEVEKAGLEIRTVRLDITLTRLILAAKP